MGVEFQPDFISMLSVFESAKAQNRSALFLKIDIEGFEYRILDEIIQYSDILTGVVIEFHDCDLHMHRILKFISEFLWLWYICTLIILARSVAVVFLLLLRCHFLLNRLLCHFHHCLIRWI